MWKKKIYIALYVTFAFLEIVDDPSVFWRRVPKYRNLPYGVADSRTWNQRSGYNYGQPQYPPRRARLHSNRDLARRRQDHDRWGCPIGGHHRIGHHSTQHIFSSVHEYCGANGEVWIFFFKLPKSKVAEPSDQTYTGCYYVFFTFSSYIHKMKKKNITFFNLHREWNFFYNIEKLFNGISNLNWKTSTEAFNKTRLDLLIAIFLSSCFLTREAHESNQIKQIFNFYVLKKDVKK